MYDADGLEKAIDDLVKKHAVNAQDLEKGGNTPLLQSDEKKPKMFMCATLEDHDNKVLLKSYHVPYDEKAPREGIKHDFWDSITILQAARATSAAPLYLPKAEYKAHALTDGGLLNNNPIDQVWDARFDLVEPRQPAPNVSVVISLGTTREDEKVKLAADHLMLQLYSRTFGKVLEDMVEIGRNVIDGIATASQAGGEFIDSLYKVLNFTTNTEARHLDFRRRLYFEQGHGRQAGTPQTRYYRFDADVPKPIALDDLAGMRKSLVTETETYLANEKTQGKITECARLLAKT
ncbi:hypothetical protein PG999_005387 [Apiospora kogelbergensis]|uniref:PNPLA domain-containing protein n=1 Tax=Apiospora kogelbergensis TaxID=1337665 RepID=A0AAW0R1Y4_9PEZI